MIPRTMRLPKAVPALLATTLGLGISTYALCLPGAQASSAPDGPAVAAPSVAGPAAGAAREVLVTGTPDTIRAAEALVGHAAGYTDLPVMGGFAARLTSAQRARLTALGAHVSDDAPVRVKDADWGAGSHAASAVYPQVDGATAAWAQGVDGRGVAVAVIDTGISNTGDLAGKVVDGYDFSGEGSYTTDSFGHGTFVAGTIAGSGAASGGAIKGVAPGVNLVALKVAGADGSSDVVRVISAIQWAVDHAAVDNIRVLNLSLGTDSTQSWRVDPLDAAVEGAWRSGLVVTVAAGNEGSAGISKPGDDPWVITVGASDDATTPSNSDDSIPPFSSTGPTADGLAKPDLVAPGTHVVSSRSPGSTVDNANPTSRIDPVYFRGSGTSFAAPQVAGAAALLLQQRPTLTNNQVKTMLVGSADALPGVPATSQGAGELDIRSLLAAPVTTGVNAGLGQSDGSGSPLASEGSLAGDAQASGGDAAAWNTATWDSKEWNSKEWNSAAWNSTEWNSKEWNAALWNSTEWTSKEWNSLAWDSGTWDSKEWNSVEWNSMTFWSTEWN